MNTKLFTQQLHCSRLAGPAQRPSVDIPHLTAVSAAWRAVGAPENCVLIPWGTVPKFPTGTTRSFPRIASTGSLELHIMQVFSGPVRTEPGIRRIITKLHQLTDESNHSNNSNSSNKYQGKQNMSNNSNNWNNTNDGDRKQIGQISQIIIINQIITASQQPFVPLHYWDQHAIKGPRSSHWVSGAEPDNASHCQAESGVSTNQQKLRIIWHKCSTTAVLNKR